MTVRIAFLSNLNHGTEYVFKRRPVKKLLPILVIVAMMVSLLPLTAVPAGAVVISRTYTLDADFGEGTLVNVNHETPNNDQLQLSDELQTLPFIWVANSGENTVSKIDTVTGIELGRYFTGPGDENPSRTTVDTNGDLWVGNRDSNTATKIALYPTDTTGGEASKPDIFTPAYTIPDGVINTSTGPGDVKAWGQDDAVLMRIEVDFGPRAVAVDAANNVWIGGYGQTMGYYDGQTGAWQKNIPIGLPCYGALVDGSGTLWISNQAYGSLTRIDNPSGTDTVTTIPTGDGWVYGISIDSSGFIYTSAWQNNRLRKLDPATNGWLYSVTIPGGASNRGVCVGQDGDVWMAHSGANSVTRHNASDGSLKATITVGNTPTGVATDAAGKIWVTNLISNDVMRIDPSTELTDLTLSGHTYPYNYSDMTGYISRNVTTKTGTWTVDFDSEVSDMPWGKVSWNSNEPEGTSVSVQVRSRNDDGDTWSGWETATNGVALSTTPNGWYLQIETTLKIKEGDISPILYDLTVEVGNLPPTADAGEDQIVEQTSYEGAEVTLDGSGSTDDGLLEPLTYKWTWAGGSAEGVSPTVIFPLGTAAVTLTVFDGQFTDTDTTNITVEDTTPPAVWCVEAVNLYGENVPGENRSDNAKSKAKNPDGFYQLFVNDICDSAPVLYIGIADNPYLFGPFESGVVIKFTEALGADTSIKKIGSSNGQAGAVAWHITLPTDPVVTGVDISGNTSTCAGCLVPPSPK